MKTRRNPLLWTAAGFIVLLFLYYAWMTGFTFAMSELPAFPNYNMLAKSFLTGRLDLQESPRVDYSLFEGKKFLYFGPAPALFHVFFQAVGWKISSGFMIVLFAAGTWAMFLLILVRLRRDHTQRSFEPLKVAFAVMFALNGFSLWMVSVPSIHHEAICSAIFFLFVGLYFVLKVAHNSYTASMTDGLIIGLSLALSLSSRFSYFLTIAFLVAFMLKGIWRENERGSRPGSFVLCAIMAGMPLCTLLMLLAYNYARFGSLTEFGMKHMISTYSEYLRHGNFFRYEHIPYNLWAYMFSLPQGEPHFPYIDLPFYILKAESVSGMPYHLLHVNELCASVFCLLPALLFCFVPVFRRAAGKTVFQQSAGKLFGAILALQIVPLSMGMAAITRYCYDFLPIMMIIAFLGLDQVQEEFRHKKLMLVIISAISIVFSFAVTVNAVRFYEALWPAQAGLLNFF